MDYDAQLAGGGDRTEYSGPGFYVVSGDDPDTTIEASQTSYGHNYQLAIYTIGLSHSCRLPDVYDDGRNLRDSSSL